MPTKPSCQVLKQPIKGKWRTHTEARSGTSGETRFRGFFGDYEVTVSTEGTVWTGRFSFEKSTAGPMAVRIRE